MRILVAGAGGMLGGKVVKTLAARHDVVAATRRGAIAMDLEDEGAVARVLDAQRPDRVVNCAAWTAVDACEDDPERAFRANAEAPGILARACAARGVPLLHYSTDYVFSGDEEGERVEDDRPDPRSVYGKSKLEGERRVQEAGGAWTIVRVQWLYGEGGRNFADTILELSRKHPELSVVDDQHGSPTWTGDVAAQTLVLLENDARGLFHCSAGGATTWYGFTKALLAAEGRADHPVRPVATEAFPRPAPRPRNGVLSNARLRAAGLDVMPDWREGIARWMREDRGVRSVGGD